MLCNIKPVPFHESDKHIFAKIPGGGGVPDPRSPPLDPPMSPMQKHVRKVVSGFGKKSCVITGVRKPGNTCVSPTAMI